MASGTRTDPGDVPSSCAASLSMSRNGSGCSTATTSYMLVAAPRHHDGVSAGCAPSGLALHLHEHQGCRRGAQVLGDADLVSRIALHMKGATRASICSSISGDMGVDAGDPAQH